ncbi:beta-phosphoglucomutase [Bacillus sp. BGMRC 2118]|nr:beta-phosphoglucomutase [Bacillus sp. BGMRC 2118]
MIKAFIFDLDGVITDTAEYHYLAWKALAEEVGITFDREFNEKLKGVSRMDSLERILELGGKQHDFSIEEKEQLATKKNEHYKQLIAGITAADILPGIEELLKEIKKNGYLLGLASASKNAPEVLRSLGLYDQFDCIADAAAVEKSKPAPDIFLLAASMLKVEPSQCIGIEDAESGIEAIQSANMFSVGVGDEESLKSADYYVPDTTELSLQAILNASHH